MLSGETAIGQYPVEAVAMMSRIVQRGREPHCSPSCAGRQLAWTWPAPALARIGRPPATGSPRARGVARAGRVQPITESVVEAASLISRRLNAALLVVATHSGRTALALSKHRNPHADPGPGQRPRDGPRHGPVLGSHTLAVARYPRPRRRSAPSSSNGAGARPARFRRPHRRHPRYRAR